MSPLCLGGHADNSVKLISPDGAKTLETAVGHCAPVTCLALSPDNNYLVTGSRDTIVLLWKMHQSFTSQSNTMLESATGSGTPPSTSATATVSSDKRRRRIEGPIRVLRGHQREILCCCVNSDLGIVVSCSQSSDVLLHSIRRGRLIRRLSVEAHTIGLSSEGVVLTWNKTLHTLNTFTLNGIPIATAQLPIFGSVSCIELSLDGKSALIGVNASGNNGAFNDSWDLTFKKSGVEDFCLQSDETGKINRLDVPCPSVCFLDLHTLKVLD